MKPGGDPPLSKPCFFEKIGGIGGVSPRFIQNAVGKGSPPDSYKMNVVVVPKIDCLKWEGPTCFNIVCKKELHNSLSWVCFMEKDPNKDLRFNSHTYLPAFSNSKRPSSALPDPAFLVPGPTFLGPAFPDPAFAGPAFHGPAPPGLVRLRFLRFPLVRFLVLWFWCPALHALALLGAVFLSPAFLGSALDGPSYPHVLVQRSRPSVLWRFASWPCAAWSCAPQS